MTSFAGRLFAAKPLRAGVGADAIAESYNVTSLSSGKNEIAILSSKTTGFPVWAYAREERAGVFSEIWLYLAQVGVPIYSANLVRWTSVGTYVSQSADAADAMEISTVDVTKGGVLRSANRLYASDALGVSEVMLGLDVDPEAGGNGLEVVPFVHVKAAKGLATADFTPTQVDRSLKASSLGLTSSESKSLPAPPTNALPPTKKATVAPASKPFPTGKWLVGGTIMGGLLWALGRRP